MAKSRKSAPVMPPPERRLVLGVIGAPHGVRGEARIKSFTADPTAIADYGPLFSTEGRVFEIVAGRPLKDDMLVVAFAGIRDRDAIKALTGTELFVDRALLPEPMDEDEFYHADLIGLEVVDLAGDKIGILQAILDFGAGDLLEIRPCGGGASWLQPFTRLATPRVDLAGRRLVIDPAHLAKPEARQSAQSRGTPLAEEGGE